MNLFICMKQGLIYCSFLFLIFLSSPFDLSAEQIDWIEVSKTNDELQFIDPNSIKYNNRGFLSVVTKHSEINQEAQEIVYEDYFLMAIDCDNRLYSKLPINSELKQVKNWETPLNDKLIKKTIISSCSY